MKLPKYNQLSQKMTVVCFSLLLGVFCAAVQTMKTASAASAWNFGPNTLIVPVDPRATFLHTCMNENPEVSDDPATPTVIDLAQAGLTAGTEIKLTYQVVQPFSYICGADMPKYQDPMFIAVFSRSNNLLPPSENHRIPDAIKIGDDEVRTGPVGMAEASEPDDIAEDFQILPTSGATVRIPEGATHLFLGIVDSFYKDNCGALTVTIERAQTFDILLQDNTSGDMLRINSFTGDYQFTRCGAEGFVRNDTGGRRAISRLGSRITLNDALVSAVVDTASFRGSATIKNPNLIGPNFAIQDSDTRNNTGTCPIQ